MINMNHEHSGVRDSCVECLREEGAKLRAEIAKLKGEPFTCGHDPKYVAGACAACHATWIERAQKAELQVGEVTAHRDRLRDMLNGIRGDILQAKTVHEISELAAKIMRRIEGPDEDVEKQEGTCTRNAINPGPGHTICLNLLPCKDHGP